MAVPGPCGRAAAAVSGGRFSRRASLHAFRAASRDVEGICADDLVVLAGVSAAEQYAIDIAAPDVVEAYVDDAALRDLRQYFMEPADPAAANVLLRVVPANVAAILRQERFAPRAAVALDLLESDDERSRRAGQQALAQLVAAA